MNPNHTILGIKGLEGRDPIGAVLTVGKKDDRGIPREKDRFHLVLPREAADDKGVSRRLAHPAFDPFNNEIPEKRRVVRGNLVHATQAECFEYGLKAQLLKKPAHPKMAPQCTGNGERAMRWVGPGADQYQEIECLGERCPYRMSNPAACKPHMRFLFRIVWREDSKLPRMLCKFTSGSWNTVRSFKGFFDYIQRTAAQLGVREPSFFDFSFVLTLSEQTSKEKQSRFPVTTITPDDVDPIEFFLRQNEARATLAAYRPEALPDPSQQDNRERLADVRGLSRGPSLEMDVADAVVVGEAPTEADLCDGSGFIPIPGSEQARLCGGCKNCVK